MGTKSNVDQLNSFLRGELSAVETYRMALDKLDATSPARFEIEACMQSHQQRVSLLREAVIAIGGTPADGSGAWGAFAKAVEGTAKAFGEKAAIAALEEGEDHGLKDYKNEVDDEDLDLQTRNIVVAQLLPAQQATHNRMSSLKKQMRS
ncbi:MAG TPA: DUF2383 domain-containing protein [Kofleriaceae bacterium]|jgi:hypothetical protein|nr:DUF2383 domain-containing protein [Kofleriaceae bacterium]